MNDLYIWLRYNLLKSKESFVNCEKLHIDLWEKNRLQGKKLRFENFDFDHMRKNKKKRNNEKICNRFSDTVSLKMAFTNFHKDHPPTWELSKKLGWGLWWDFSYGIWLWLGRCNLPQAVENTAQGSLTSTRRHF